MTTIVLKERFPWYMSLTCSVGVISLLTGIGTLTAAFRPMFGVWALGAALLLDALALALTVWAIQSVRQGILARPVRLSAHGCILASMAAQATTAASDAAGGAISWVSAVMHTIAPAVLGLVLELIYQHFALKARKDTAPQRAAETMRVQLACAVVGRPVDLGDVQASVIEAARADVIDVRDLAGQLHDEDLLSIPAMRALHSVVDPESALALTSRLNAQRALEAAGGPGKFQLLPGMSVPEDRMSPAERRREVWRLTDQGLTTRAVAARVGCSPATVSNDLKIRSATPADSTEGVI